MFFHSRAKSVLIRNDEFAKQTRAQQSSCFVTRAARPNYARGYGVSWCVVIYILGISKKSINRLSASTTIHIERAVEQIEPINLIKARANIIERVHYRVASFFSSLFVEM